MKTSYCTEPLSLDEQVLVEKYMPLVQWEVKRQHPRNRDERDEWIQEGVFGLVRAIRTHDRDQSSLTNWIVLNVRYCLYKYRDGSGFISVPKIVHGINKSYAERARQIVLTGSMEDYHLESYDSPVDDEMSLALSKLRSEDREVLDLHFKQNMTQVEIAARLGITHQRVSQKLRTALRNLRIIYSRFEDKMNDSIL